MSKYIFGPVNSRRFGVSLGIDLSPDKKSCNFDCLYCELEKAKPVNRIENEPDPYEILEEVKDFLKQNDYPDVITVTANGEPTLYSKLDVLIEELNRIKGSSKTLILSNGSTIVDKSVRDVLKKFDIVKLSLDAVDEVVFQKVDRPLEEVDIDSLVEAMKTFRGEYKGVLVIEVLLVKGINDSEDDIKRLVEKIRYISPDRVDLGTIDRPPAYRVFPVNDKKLLELAGLFEGLNVMVVTRSNIRKQNYELQESEILETLTKRPLTEQDIESLYSESTKSRIKNLISKGLVRKRNVGNVVFLTATKKF